MSLTGEQRKALSNYLSLMKERPYLFKNDHFPYIVTDQKAIESFESRTGTTIGVVYSSDYSMLVVDLVKNPDGSLCAYERIVPTVETGAVVVIPIYQNKVILLKQYRHALRGFQLAFPRGYGEQGISADDNAKKEVLEEIDAAVHSTERIGRIVADSGLSGKSADVFVCEVSAPSLKKDYEGIEEVYCLAPDRVASLIAEGKIDDGFSLAAWCLFNEKWYDDGRFAENQ